MSEDIVKQLKEQSVKLSREYPRGIHWGWALLMNVASDEITGLRQRIFDLETALECANR